MNKSILPVILSIIVSITTGIFIGWGLSKYLNKQNNIPANYHNYEEQIQNELTQTLNTPPTQKISPEPQITITNTPSATQEITPPTTTYTTTLTPTQTPTPKPVYIKKYLLIEPYTNKKFVFKLKFNKNVTHKYVNNHSVKITLNTGTAINISLKQEAYPQTLQTTSIQLNSNIWGKTYLVKQNKDYFYTNQKPQIQKSCHIMDNLIKPPCGYLTLITNTNNLPKVTEIKCIVINYKKFDLKSCQQVFQSINILKQ